MNRYLLLSTIEETLREQGYIIQPIVGDSMLPMLMMGKDFVRLVPVSQLLKKSDVVLYKRPSGQYVLHRILFMRKHYLVICGDNRVNAEKVPYGWIIGVMQGVYKSGKYISCEDEEYLRYARRRRRNRSLRCFLLKFALFRLVRKVKHFILGKIRKNANRKFN